MDLLLTNVLYSKLREAQTTPKEGDTFQDGTTPPPPSTGSLIIVNIISIIIGIFAAYLSWSCNTAEGVSTGLKILYSFFAFLFGLLYLIYYAIFRAGKCYPPPQVVYVPQPAPVQTTQQPATVGGKKGRSKH